MKTIILDRTQRISLTVTNVFLKATHRYCMRHRNKNLWSQHKNDYAWMQFWKVTRMYKLFDIEHILKYIEDNDCDIHAWINQVGHYRCANTHFQRRRYCVLTTSKLECTLEACKKISDMLPHRAYEKGVGQSLPQASMSGRILGGDFDTKSLCTNRSSKEEGTRYGHDVTPRFQFT